MSALSKQSRSKLESIVQKARNAGEKAALTELDRLGVGEAAAPGYLSAEEKELRRRLREHGRQLGDGRIGKDGQELQKLASEVAYEHWHRMLFARFLAENELLIHPVHKVSVSLADCDELAHEEDQAGGAAVTRWDLAARFASAILPQIFRTDSPSLAVRLAPDERQALEALLAALPMEVFTADDSLGWVYQFWQAEAKDRVNKSRGKIGAAELPAVTQLFTEDYMVEFLLDNSLGAWWASKRLEEGRDEDFGHREDETQRREDNKDEEKDGKLKIEEELKKRVALPGLPFRYLRFVEDEEKGWRAAAGGFEEWPAKAAGLRCLDPCCGSGHFLVAGYRYLTAMRMAEEGLDVRAAGDAVLRDNLFGLELDPRCVEIAVFSLAFEAWRSGGGYRELPELHVACSGTAPRTSKDEWLQVADKAAGLIAGDAAELIPGPNKASLWKSELHEGMEALYELFKDAPVLGSLIDPRSITGTLFRAGFDHTADLLASALKKECALDESRETGVAAQGIAKAANLLAGRYHLVATNVPYLSRSSHNEALRAFCDEHYPEAKNDLATVFLDRCLALCEAGGTTTVVLPHYWLFLGGYKKIRDKLLKHDRWHMLARLGPGAFETISGEIVNVALIIISPGQDRKRLRQETSVGSTWRFAGIDAAAPREPAEKAGMLRSGAVAVVGQAGQLGNPDGRIVFGSKINHELLSKVSNSYQGLSPADAPRFGLLFWEIHRNESFWQGACLSDNMYSGYSQCIKLNEVKLKAERNEGAYIRGSDAWGKKGISIAQMSDLPAALFLGVPFDTNAAVIVPTNPAHLPAIWCFCSSPQYNEEVRKIDQSLKVTNATLVQVPFDLAYWTQVAQERYPHGVPEPFSDDPTQWIFHGHPCASVLWSEADKRLVHGPARRDATVLQVAVARLLGYRWPAELDAAMELSAESRAIVATCSSLSGFADDDGIVCVPSVNREKPAADRLLALLAAAYSNGWSPQVLFDLLGAVEYPGKDLESWLRDGFFEQHCKLFGYRPFVWQVWDGLKDGFSALVNYHGLSKARLEKLVYVYLGGWIGSQEEAVRSNVRGAEQRLAAALELKTKLEKILEGEAPYDIFVRWKGLSEQPLGWDPDLNDGVRMNIRPFVTAGVLRHCKPPRLNVKWDVDRGNDVQSAPWYPVFQGKRVNDHHTTLGEKRKAREEA